MLTSAELNLQRVIKYCRFNSDSTSSSVCYGYLILNLSTQTGVKKIEIFHDGSCFFRYSLSWTMYRSPARLFIVGIEITVERITCKTRFALNGTVILFCH